MFRTNAAVNYMDKRIATLENDLEKSQKELEKSKKIQSDHCERIRVLELAIQKCLDPRCDNLIYIDMTLMNAIAESHKIALKEY